MNRSPSTLPPIIDVERWEALSAEQPVRLVDVRWALDGSKDRDTYRAGHLPEAVYVDLGEALAGPPSPQEGRHPLPDPAAFARSMREAGIGDHWLVVVYDDTDGSQASRLVWMLRAGGVEAALLDGGLSAWIAAHPGSAPETGDVRPEPAEFTARPWSPEVIASIDEVAAAGADPARILIDARAPERYRGDSEPIDPRAGHVPGAINVPFSGNVDADGRFLAPAALRERFAAHGVRAGDGVIVYCGSGVTATHDLLALEHAGLRGARLFPGSWSQWSADAQRPVATGEEPGGASGA